MGELAQINPYAVEFRYGDEVIRAIDPVKQDALAARIVTWTSKTIDAMQS